MFNQRAAATAKARINVETILAQLDSDELELRDFVQIRAFCEKRIQQLKTDHFDSIVAEFKKTALEMDIDPEELADALSSTGNKGRKRVVNNGKIAAKYRDPDNPENTWSGRGKRPRWMQSHLKAKKYGLDDMKIA